MFFSDLKEDVDDPFEGIMSSQFRRNLKEMDDIPLRRESREVLKRTTQNKKQLSKKYAGYKL